MTGIDDPTQKGNNVHMSERTQGPRVCNCNFYQAALQESPSLSAPVLSIWKYEYC